jgi:hypothetical protein
MPPKKKPKKTEDEIEREKLQALESLQVMLNANGVVPRKTLVKAVQVGLSVPHSSGVSHFDTYLSLNADSRGYLDEEGNIIDGLVDATKGYFHASPFDDTPRGSTSVISGIR